MHTYHIPMSEIHRQDHRRALLILFSRQRREESFHGRFVFNLEHCRPIIIITPRSSSGTLELFERETFAPQLRSLFDIIDARVVSRAGDIFEAKVVFGLQPDGHDRFAADGDAHDGWAEILFSVIVVLEA